MNRHPAIAATLRAGVLVPLALAALASPASPAPAEPTLVVRWNEVLLECVRRSSIGPPMVARAIGEVHTCGFDAWAMYDDVAVSTRLGAALRRPPAERTPANKEKAFSYGAYRGLLDLFPDQSGFIRERMAALGFDPDDATADPATPQGVGNLCAAAVIEFRHGDGSNQLGDLHPGAYSDYTGYAPVNGVDRIVDPNRWQPLRFSDGRGGTIVPGYIGPHWGHVTPFALASSSQFRPPPPHFWPHGRYVAQAEEVLHLNAHLDDRRKMIAQYWADGPSSELPPGHWMLFAAYVSARDRHTFDRDVELFFTLGNAMLDAGIATWEAKRHYDYVRPVTAIRFLKRGKRVLATVPFRGRTVIRGEDWLPYQPATFLTPPFAEYTSGHSAFSAAGAEILARFTGSDAFGASVTIPAGSSRVEPGFAPSRDVTLSWATFSAAADEAGMSRRFGGIHFEDGDLRGRTLGRQVAAVVWEKARTYIEGAAPEIARRAVIATAEPRAADAAAARPRVALAGIAPNPSPGPIRFVIVASAPARVRLDVLDVQGRAVAALADRVLDPGRHEIAWDGRDGAVAAAGGVYFARLRGPGTDLVRRFAVAR